MKPVLHRDSVHQDTWFDPLSAALLDSAPMQRLGRVLQLGYAHLVYRGGTHTRLSHVMGASHVAGMLVAKLRQNYEGVNAQFRPLTAVSPTEFLPFAETLDGGVARRERGSSAARSMLAARWDFLEYTCRWAALLHDVGHIPLGHTLEDEFDQIFRKHDDFSNPRLTSIWFGEDGSGLSEIGAILRSKELYPLTFGRLDVSPDDVFNTVLLICCHKEKRDSEGMPGESFQQLLQRKAQDLQDAIGANFATQLLTAYQRQTGQARRNRRTFNELMVDLVANTICADYLDYMRRDPLYVGFDVLMDDRVASRFYVGKHPTWGYRMALSLLDRADKKRTDTASGVFELVRQRYRFAEAIYYHKTKVAASAMFVKALTLLNGVGDHITAHGAINDIVVIDQIPELSDVILREPSLLDDMASRYLPQNLLSPEIGDDSLNLFLQHRAWKLIGRISAGPDTQDKRLAIERCLLAISLFSGISRRKLYKVAMALEAEHIARLAGQSPENKEETARAVIKMLEKYRPDHEGRAALEAEMCKAANFPDGSIILYLPERKSQAKGVETFALTGSGVSTLGQHLALKRKMEELIADYTNLWKFLVFVHPKHASNLPAVSAAADVLITRLLEVFERKSSSSERTDLLTSAFRGSYFSARHQGSVRSFCLLQDKDKMALDETFAASFFQIDNWADARGTTLSARVQADLTFVHMLMSEKSRPLSESQAKAVRTLCAEGVFEQKMKTLAKSTFDYYSGESTAELFERRNLLAALAAELSHGDDAPGEPK
jgi:HD superfamily phosphohydrolase